MKLRIALRITASLCLLIVLIVISGALLVRTEWFKDKVKDNIIAGIERTTGGRVELGSFDFDWRRLTARLGQFTLHGTEPAAGMPLFHGDSIVISLRIISWLERNVDISSVVVDRSETYLLVRPDGSTNIPGPRQHTLGQIAGDLLNVKIGHFEFRNAILQTGLKRISLSVRGEALRLSLAYKSHPSRYDVLLSSDKLFVESPQLNNISGRVNVQAELQRDQINFERVALESGYSTIALNGVVRRFNDPIADAQLIASLTAADIAQHLNFAGLTGGQIRLDGTVHYGRSTSASFRGSVAGKNIAFSSGGLQLNGANLSFTAEGNPDKIGFSRLALSNSDISLDAAGTLSNLNMFALTGNVARLSIGSAVRRFRVAHFPYSGTVSGSFQLKGALRKGLREVELWTSLHIKPRAGGIPVSGDVNASYSQRTRTLEFTDSHLDTANSHLAFAGSPGKNVAVKLSSTDVSDLLPALQSLPFKTNLRFDRVAFDGQLAGAVSNPAVTGDLSVEGLGMNGMTWNDIHSRIATSASQIEFTSLSARQGAFHLNADGSVALNDWAIKPDSAMHIKAGFNDAEISRFRFSPQIHGTASGSFVLAGTVGAPSGRGRFSIDNLDAYGERVDQTRFNASVDSDTVSVTDGRLHAGSATLSFSGNYAHRRADWTSGDLQMRIDSNGFPLTALAFAKRLLPAVAARLEVHANLRARLTKSRLEPENAGGTLNFTRVTLDGAPLGDVTVNAATHGEQLSVGVAGNLEDSPVSGNLRAHLVDSDLATGELHFGRISLSTIYGLSRLSGMAVARANGFVHGSLSFDGPLLRPREMNLQLRIDELQMNSPRNPIAVHNTEPILIDARGGTATVRNLQLASRDTQLNVAGTFGYEENRPLNLQVEGSSDFRLLQIFDPNLQSAGQSLLKVSIGGTFDHPSVDGTIDVRGGSLFVKNFTNGLSNVNGTIRFNRDRATIQKLTAETGGGELGLTGFVSLGARGTAIYNLQASATNVRVRYTGASVTANGRLELTGNSQNGLLSGRVTVSRIIIGQNADLGNMLASTVSPASPPGNDKDLINGLLLDLRVQSSPNLQISTDLSQDVEADIDLRVRGTAAHPILLGSISANQGEIKVFGAKYSINRGDITFVNSVKIEPVLDLDLQTQTRGITVDITISGTLNKMNMNYRSDPPLQPKDIIALLTVGQAPSTTANPSNINANTDVIALQAGANTVLGQAISPASNRLSKLFGITNIKIDPLVQGITNTPQARLTLEQQISRDITVTYITNLAQTSEQIFRFEWALNRQFSVVAVRDDNGEFGIDFQYKKRFR
ncbi:MAG: translocation/assembly module TamB domain-containing protein [Acidobacteriota bacterium]|nr:translocation/assembly module TamB domain-containing protein [Acidobacteriota bacterium]